MINKEDREDKDKDKDTHRTWVMQRQRVMVRVRVILGTPTLICVRKRLKWLVECRECGIGIRGGHAVIYRRSRVVSMHPVVHHPRPRPRKGSTFEGLWAGSLAVWPSLRLEAWT